MQKTLTKILLAAYLVLLTWVILFKLSFSPADLDHMRSINLIPFHYDTETDFHASEVIQNVLAFAPIGIYVKMLGASGKKAVAVGFSISFTFEALQFILACGATDITDIITNTTGALLGALLYTGLSRLVSRAMLDAVFNALASIATVLLALLLVITIVANH